MMTNLNPNSMLTDEVHGVLTVCPRAKVFMLCEEGTGRMVPLSIGDMLIGTHWNMSIFPGEYKQQNAESGGGHLINLPEGHVIPQVFVKELPNPNECFIGLIADAYANGDPMRLVLKTPILRDSTAGTLGWLTPNKAAAQEFKEKLHWRLFCTDDDVHMLEAGDTLTLLDADGIATAQVELTEDILKGMEAGFKRLMERLPEWDMLFEAMRTHQQVILLKAQRLV